MHVCMYVCIVEMTACIYVCVSDILRDHGGARRYLDISAYGSATLQAPDDSSGWDETSSASPVVC